ASRHGGGRGRPLARPDPAAGRGHRRDRVAGRAPRQDRRRRSRGCVPGPGGGLVSARVTLATAGRVLRQLRRDRRTLALVLLVPPLLLTLLKYVFYGQEETFNRGRPPLVGIFPFVTMFLVSSIAM